MPKVRYIFLWWILMVLSTGNTLAQGLMIRNYNVKDGLANATVYDAVQDKEGFIWFSTPTGVSKFDGKRFRNYSQKDGLTDNDVVKLAADSKGRVWFFTLNGLPSFFWNYTIHTSQNDSSLYVDARGQYMQYMFEDYAGFIWFLNTDNRIIQYSGKKTTYDKLGALRTNLFYFLRNDTIFKPRQSYFNLPNLEDANNPDQKIITACTFPLDQTTAQRVRKQPVIVVDNNLYIYNNKEAICFLRGSDWGIRDEISNICVDNDNLWIGTPRTLYYLKGFLRGEKKPVKLLENHYITSLLKDRDGNIWITTFGDGVYNIPYKNFYFNYLDNTNGLFSHSIFSIGKDPKTGLLLIGQNAGVLNTIDSNNRYQRFNLDTSSGRNSILAILPYKPNEMLIGADNGLYSFNTASQRPSLLKRVKTLKDVDISPGGKIRIAAKNQVICDDYIINKEDELITSIACINDSAYYVGTNAGLFYGSDGSRTLKVRTTRPALHLSIKDLKWINGKLWVGTADHGLYVFRGDNSLERHLSTADKLVSDICQQLYYDGIGRLYVATNKGVSVIDVNTENLIRNITSNDGLMSDDARGVYYQHGTLYIATSNGLSYFNDAKMPVDTVPPAIYLNHVRYGDSTYLPGKEFVLMYQRKASFEVEFGAIAYDLPELVEYQYNFSSDTSSGWITTMSNIVPFPDLQPDSYQLQIRARKYKSNWSQPVVINVTILPRWYQQWWARGIVILLGLILVAFVLRDVIRRIQRAEMRKTEYNRRIAELEAKALTNQMNPHFIFNSLNSVQHLIMEKEEKQALNFLADFATLMRQMLNNSRKSFISLEEEIAFLTRYIELEKIRFANVFTYHFLQQDDLKDYTIYIPPMIIQPIVENAIKHGLAPKNGSGRLEVKLVLREDMLYCSVDDDGIGWDRANEIKSGRLVKHESTALSVIRERLQIIKSFNGNVGKLEIIDKFKSGFGNKEGTLVEILIPIVKML
ncbi:sensor histidine kinase [Chitinophaga ginsengisoli]|uniref:Two component regulator with propeller domain n=1 Tax=Chitinophaga ginsengisoli TaxID=363837 RepID=A0A2P8FWF2_9BACT|nr:histidine kinase [Chitinophaga ginsengisoli]PSL25965.1 two component regulator with propeller domain [Chitinophaga ginsengisoli]